MPNYTAKDWNEVRVKFRTSIMADTSLSSLAQNLDLKDWPVRGEEERPSKYIDFNYEELLMLPEIAGNAARADHLTAILKETLAFDDPFGEMVAQVEESAAKENPVLKTLSRLEIPENFPLSLANLDDGTRAICAGEGIGTVGEFANLGQQMATRVVIGGDFRSALNALQHGDEEGIGGFVPFRRGSLGLHLPEAIGLIAARVPGPERMALANYYGAKLPGSATGSVKAMTPDQAKSWEVKLGMPTAEAFAWFNREKNDLVQSLAAGQTMERCFVVLGDPVREAIAVRLSGLALKDAIAATSAKSPLPQEKKGLFARWFGRK